MLINVRIIGSKFYLEETEGYFVTSSNEGNKIYGLRVGESWRGLADKEQIEVGARARSLASYYDGNYPQSFYKMLKPVKLISYNKEYLMLICNEVYIQYGYTFSKKEKL